MPARVQVLRSIVDRNQPSEGTHVQEVDAPLHQIRALGKPLNQWMEIEQNTHIIEQLRHRCCICSQWIANIRSIKLHVLKVHPEIYNAAGAAALTDCKKNRAHHISFQILWYAGEQNLSACRYMSRIVADQARSYPGERSHAQLWRRTWISTKPLCTSTSFIRRGRPLSGSRAPRGRDQRSRQHRKRPKEKAAAEGGRDLNTSCKIKDRVWLKVGSRSQGVGQASASPGRLYSASPDGSHRVDDIQHRRESSEHHTDTCWGGREMEPSAPQRAEQDQSNATTYTSDLCH